MKLFQRHDNKHEHAEYVSSIIKQLLITRKNEGENNLGEFDILKFTQYWKSSADSSKKGFYVDYVDGCWVSPDSITDKEYKTMQGQADVLLAFADAFFLKGTLQELDS